MKEKERKELEKAVKEFKEQFPLTTDAYIEAFTLGWEARYSQQREWISVKDRLPKDDNIVDEVLAIGYQEEQIIGMFYESNGKYYCESDGELLEEVTHWMPKLKPPKS